MFIIRRMNILSVCFISTVVHAAHFDSKEFFQHYSNATATLVQVGKTAIERENIPKENTCLATYDAEAVRLATISIQSPLFGRKTRSKINTLFKDVTQHPDYKTAFAHFTASLNSPRLSTWAAWNFQQIAAHLVFAHAQPKGVVYPHCISNDLELIKANAKIAHQGASHLVPIKACLSAIACIVQAERAKHIPTLGSQNDEKLD